MAGIGVRLNKIYSKNTIGTSLFGFGYSTAITIAPMFLVILTVMGMQALLDFSKTGYDLRELFSCTILYIFVFALLTSSFLNAVLSKYLSDVIYREDFQDILPCFYVGLLINVIMGALVGIPFCVREYIVGGLDLYYIAAGYCGFMALILVFYAMLFLSICKDYNKISLFFLIGCTLMILVSLLLVKVLKVEITLGMLLSIDVGFVVISALMFALIRSYFRVNSGKYKDVLLYIKEYWQLVVTNFLYSLGLYVHNFVFWTTDQRTEVAKCFICMSNYDLATCLAMFTNISATVIFISRVEMNFHGRYRDYSEAVIGGRGIDINNSKTKMFEQLAEELVNLVRIQFIVSVMVFLLAMVLLPRFGYGGMVMQMYPCLAAGYFILFTMYAAIIFLYYYNDMFGAMITSVIFCLVTFGGSVVATHLTEIWYGIGLVAGSLLGWSFAYFRLRHIEKNLDVHVFCNGSLMKRGKGRKPSNLVYYRKLGRRK